MRYTTRCTILDALERDAITRILNVVMDSGGMEDCANVYTQINTIIDETNSAMQDMERHFEEAQAAEQMRRMHELAEDVQLVNAQLDADAGTAFRATEPPDDAEADGTND